MVFYIILYSCYIAKFYKVCRKFISAIDRFSTLVDIYLDGWWKCNILFLITKAFKYHQKCSQQIEGFGLKMSSHANFGLANKSKNRSSNYLLQVWWRNNQGTQKQTFLLWYITESFYLGPQNIVTRIFLWSKFNWNLIRWLLKSNVYGPIYYLKRLSERIPSRWAVKKILWMI